MQSLSKRNSNKAEQKAKNAYIYITSSLFTPPTHTSQIKSF